MHEHSAVLVYLVVFGIFIVFMSYQHYIIGHEMSLVYTLVRKKGLLPFQLHVLYDL